MKRAGKRYSALVEFQGAVRIVDDVRAWDLDHARRLMDRKRDVFFKEHQVPTFQQKTWRLLGLFYGTIHFATE